MCIKCTLLIFNLLYMSLVRSNCKLSNDSNDVKYISVREGVLKQSYTLHTETAINEDVELCFIYKVTIAYLTHSFISTVL